MQGSGEGGVVGGLEELHVTAGFVKKVSQWCGGEEGGGLGTTCADGCLDEGEGFIFVQSLYH